MLILANGEPETRASADEIEQLPVIGLVSNRYQSMRMQLLHPLSRAAVSCAARFDKFDARASLHEDDQCYVYTCVIYI